MQRFLNSRVLAVMTVAFSAIVIGWLVVKEAIADFVVDLQVYRFGGTSLLHGHSLYEGGAPGTGLPFTYSPFAALTFVPISVFGEKVAQVIWCLSMLAAFVVFVKIACEFVAPSIYEKMKYWQLSGIVALALLMEPVRANFDFGQINVFLALAILLDLTRRSGRLPTGTLIGLATAIKLTPAIFIVYLVLTGRWRDARNAVIAAAGATALGGLVAFSDSIDYWTKLAFDSSRVGGVPFVSNQSLFGLMTRLMEGADNASPYYDILNVILAAVMLTIAVVLTRRGQVVLGTLTCTLIALLVSPISWSHHWVWVVPVLLWLGLSPQARSWGRLAAIAGFVLFTAAPIWRVPNRDNAEYLHHGWQIIAANSYFLAAVAFLLLAAVLAIREVRVQVQAR